jgi:hypothetical protein
MQASTRISQGFAEILLIVKNVHQAAQFYTEVVGLVPARPANAEWAWFWSGEPGVTQRLGLHRGELLFEEHSPLSPGTRFGRVHFAFSVRRVQLEEAVEKVRSAGIMVYGPVQFKWMNALSSKMPASWLKGLSHATQDSRARQRPEKIWVVSRSAKRFAPSKKIFNRGWRKARICLNRKTTFGFQRPLRLKKGRRSLNRRRVGGFSSLEGWSSVSKTGKIGT